MPELTPLRPEDPDLDQLREAMRKGRRQQAFRLGAIGLALSFAGGCALWRGTWAHDLAAGDTAGSTLVSLALAAAGMAGALGLLLLGLAGYVLAKTRSGVTERDT